MIAPTIVFFPSNRLIKLENPPSTWCHYWLVVSTPLNKISQLGLIVLFPIYRKIKHVPNHQPEIIDDTSIYKIYLARGFPILNLQGAENLDSHRPQPGLGVDP